MQVKVIFNQDADLQSLEKTMLWLLREAECDEKGDNLC